MSNQHYRVDAAIGGPSFAAKAVYLDGYAVVAEWLQIVPGAQVGLDTCDGAAPVASTLADRTDYRREVANRLVDEPALAVHQELAAGSERSVRTKKYKHKYEVGQSETSDLIKII